MNMRSVIIGLVALVVAAVAAISARNMMAGSATPVAVAVAPPPQAQILVAAKPLPTGHILTPEDLRWQTWPKDAVDDAHIATGEGEPQQLAGKVVKTPLIMGQPVLAPLLVGPGERGFLAAVLAPDMRAVTVAVTDTSGVAGFVFPGDRVDIILTHEVPNGNGLSLRGSETLLTNVRVLATDQSTDDASEKKAAVVSRTVTLEVPPRFAEQIAVMQRLGAVSLSLRPLAQEASADGKTPAAPEVPSDQERTLTIDRQVSKLVTMAVVQNGEAGAPAGLAGLMAPPKKPDMVVARGSANTDVFFDPSRKGPTDPFSAMFGAMAAAASQQQSSGALPPPSPAP
jgi:pilus assembly protein CpaB